MLLTANTMYVPVRSNSVRLMVVVHVHVYRI